MLDDIDAMRHQPEPDRPNSANVKSHRDLLGELLAGHYVDDDPRGLRGDEGGRRRRRTDDAERQGQGRADAAVHVQPRLAARAHSLTITGPERSR